MRIYNGIEKRFFRRVVTDETGIAVVAILFVMVLLAFAIYFLYSGKKYEISEEVRKATVWSVGFYSKMESMVPDGMERASSFDAKTNQLTIILGEREYYFQIDPKEDIENMNTRVAYDLNLKNPITLGDLDSLVAMRVKASMSDLSLVFRKVDSLEITKDIFPPDAKLEGLEKACEVPLGFISGDRVEVYVDFSWGCFCRKYSLLLGITAALGIWVVYFLCLFVYRIKRQKRLQEMQDDCLRQEMHDFNIPVNGVKTTLEWVLLKFGGTLQEQDVRRCELAKEGLQSMISNRNYMLEVLSEMCGIRVEREVFDLRSALERLIEVQEMASKSVPSLRIELDYRLTETEIYASPVYLLRAIGNLLDNAVKYSGERVVVVIRCYAEKQGVVIAVEDQGTGIPLSEQRKIFAKYYRSENKKVKGFGLGLAFVREVVRKHGGRITLVSEVGKGSTFYIYLKKWKQK